MKILYRFNDIEVSYDSEKIKTWIGNAPDRLNYFGKGSLNKASFFEINLNSSQFQINLNCIYWEEYEIYELNPSVIKGNEALQTLRSRLRVTAKSEIVRGEKMFLVQLRIAKLKKTQPLHSNLYDSNENQLSEICRFDIREKLIFESGCIYMDTKKKLTGDTGIKREKQYVAFKQNNYKAMINFFIITRVYPMLKNIHE